MDEAFGALLLAHTDAIVVDTLIATPSDLEGFHRVASMPVIYLVAAASRWNPAILPIRQSDYLVARPIDSTAIAHAAELVLNLSVAPSVAAFEVVGLRVDMDAHTLSGPDTVVSLTRTEARLLRCLADVGGQVVSVEEMMRTVWNIDPSTGSRAMVRAHIRNLRAKLKRASGADGLLGTVHRRGYRLLNLS